MLAPTEMIELINRKELLARNTTFSSYLLELQQVMYNPLINGNLYIAGEIYSDDETEERRLLTQKECEKLNREALEEFEKNKDTVDPTSVNPDFKGSAIYALQPADRDTYLLNLAEGIRELSLRMNWGETIFMLVYSTPWLYQQNEYKPVKEALDYLKQLGVKEDFAGGFKVGASELPTFIQHLFWIVRCNASLPCCYFTGANVACVMHLCKYGDIHFDFYSEEEKIRIQKIAADIGMIEITNGECQDNFSENGHIDGREIMV